MLRSYAREYFLQISVLTVEVMAETVEILLKVEMVRGEV
jgi:hypothetical protein